MEDITMLFLTYWELNENMSDAERAQVAQKLTSSGLFPPPGVNIIRWDATPDGWGILLAEAESVADINRGIGMWRVAGAGFFKSTRTAPAQPVTEALAQTGELLQALASV
jgi:hypothetical protein